MDKLKPCPFCGYEGISIMHSEVKYLGQNEAGNKKHIYKAYARCNKCFSRGKPISFEWISNITGCKLTLKEHEDAAIEAWNRRSDNATEDAEPVVHAHWMEDGEVVVCSNCGEEHAWLEYRASYCEDCGAKMDEED